MGKKGNNWFSSVKKVFKSSSKDLPEKKKNNAEKGHHEAPEVVSFEHFPTASSPDITNDESTTATTPVIKDRNHAVATPQAAAKVVRMAGCGRQFKKERAAIFIQSYYRGYLARRALRALKGLVRLQALVRGYNVRKQAQMTMRCMQALVRVQARVKARRLKLTHDRLQSKMEEEKAKHLSSTWQRHEADSRNGRRLTSESYMDNDFRKHDGILEKERALAYAFNYQLHPEHLLRSDYDDHGYDIAVPCANEHGKTQRGWNWLERRMPSQPYHAGAHAASYMPFAAQTSTTTATDNTSEKTVEMDTVAVAVAPMTMSMRINNMNMGLVYRDVFNESPRSMQQCKQTSPSHKPSYMGPTQSAKAKARSHGVFKVQSPIGSQWNHSTKRTANSGFDSSSSSGGIGSFQWPRSPSSKINGLRPQSQRIASCSPEPNGVEDWTLPLGGVGWT